MHLRLTALTLALAASSVALAAPAQAGPVEVRQCEESDRFPVGVTAGRYSLECISPR